MMAILKNVLKGRLVLSISQARRVLKNSETTVLPAAKMMVFNMSR